jgi:lipoprotein-releasing system permease protein
MNLITIIAIGGIGVGVMALIVVIGVMSGLQTEVRDRILGTNPHIMVLTFGEGLRLDDWEQPLEQLRQDEAVTIAEPFIYTESLIFQDVNYQQGVAVRGVTADATARLEDQLLVGSWNFENTESGLPGIVLGFRLADRLLVYPGDTVSLISAHGAELTPAGFIPKFKKFEVVGLFKSGMFEYDNQMGYAQLNAAQDLLGMESAVTGLALWVTDPWQADAYARRLQAELGYPYTLRDWKRMNEGLFSALKLEKMGMALVLALIVLVAAFNIVSTLIMVVADKTREIGILRSMGLTSRGRHLAGSNRRADARLGDRLLRADLVAGRRVSDQPDPRHTQPARRHVDRGGQHSNLLHRNHLPVATGRPSDPGGGDPP